MASADFWHSISAPLDADSTRQSVRSPRVLRTHRHAYACRIYAASFCTSIGLCISWPAHPNASPLSASCSSGQRFATASSGFPVARDTLAAQLTLPLVGCVGDFHPQVGAPCRAHQKKPAVGNCRPRATCRDPGGDFAARHLTNSGPVGRAAPARWKRAAETSSSAAPQSHRTADRRWTMPLRVTQTSWRCAHRRQGVTNFAPIVWFCCATRGL